MNRVICGIDLLSKEKKPIKDLRLGLITNHTGLNSQLASTIDVLNQIGDLRFLFSPEHGVRGNLQAGDYVPEYIDKNTGIKVFSLYGETRIPKQNMLEYIDAFIFDLQDIGTRYFTYIYTMANAMQAAARHEKKFIVLDRPNPINGKAVEGNLLDPKFSSFVGMYPISTRHGLTIGELALLFNEEFEIKCDLEIIKIENWKRGMYFEDTGLKFVAPSPNIPTIDTTILYPGTCLLEGTNLSEGRGTTQPFQLVGAPWLDGSKLAHEMNKLELEGVKFRQHYFVPTFSKYKGELCEGVQIHILDREKIQSFKVGLYLLDIIYKNYGELEFTTAIEQQNRYFIDLLAGTDELRESIISDNVHTYLDKCNNEIGKFKSIREKYILYN